MLSTMNLTTLKNYVSAGKTRQALEALKEAVSPQSNFYNDLLMLMADFSENSRAIVLDLQSPEENRRERKRINNRLLTFLDSLTPDDFKTTTAVTESINQPLLVITPNVERQSLMQDLFYRLGMTSAQVEVFAETLGWSAYEIIVFDNEDLPQGRDLSAEQHAQTEAREAQMKYVLENSRAVLVHFGGHLNLVNQHRSRMQAANSKFTLYARIREVADFLNAMRLS